MIDASDLLRAIARLGHTLGRQRVIDQEFDRLDSVGAGRIAIQLFEHGRHAERIVAGGRHRADADAVGLEFLGPRVVDLMLNGGALARQDGAFHGVGIAAAGGRTQQNGGQHRSRRDQARMRLVDHAAHQMPLGDVRRFVRHDAGKLIFVARREDQAAVDGDEAARHRKGIDDGIAHHEVVELVLAFLGMAREAMADFLNVVADFGIFEDHTLSRASGGPTSGRLGIPPRAKPPQWRGCPNRADLALLARKTCPPSRRSRPRPPRGGGKGGQGFQELHSASRKRHLECFAVPQSSHSNPCARSSDCRAQFQRTSEA